ncbi:hypothetical protein KJ359_012507 [Pestalotiopsis sp. 9143b]|nr:hypothetical protein KJ359_012507 [Pestalotiopsis sp. 9143b]
MKPQTGFSSEADQMTTSSTETCGSTLADLYACLSKVNKQLAGVPTLVPLGTSKRENAWVSRDRMAKERKEAATRKGLLEAAQRALRVDIEVMSRRGLRDLHILDLPEEILYHIFEHLRGAPSEVAAGGFSCSRYDAREIKNVRLTCRRFNGASSHLLLSFVTLDLDMASVSRIRAISKQPLVRKGVRGIKVRTRFYDENLARNLRDFAMHNMAKVDRELSRLHGLRDLSQSNTNDKDFKKARSIMESWGKLVSDLDRPSPVQDSCSHYEKLIIDAHKEYRARWKEQCDLLANGSFVKEVGQAISCIPSIAGIQLCGGSWFDNVHVVFGVLKSDHILRQALLLPMSAGENHRRPLLESIQALRAWGRYFYDRDGPSAISGAMTQLGVGTRRRQLPSVMLSSFIISTSLLESFLQSLAGSPLNITLKSVMVGSGDTWEDVLDLLRQHNYCEWHIDDPAGAECTRLGMVDRDLIFGHARLSSSAKSKSKPKKGPSSAESYVAGTPGFTNPFARQEIDDQE